MLRIRIAGVEVQIMEGSCVIEERIEERSTASFTVLDLPGTANYVRGMPVEILDSADRLFTGFIDTPGRARISPSAGGLFHDITCMDNHYLADKRLVARSYADQTLAFIVNDIWLNYLNAEGITRGQIQIGPVIKSAIFNYVRASEAFDALKELSGFIWFIDENRALHFVSRATYFAPWQLGEIHQPLEGSVRLSTGNPAYRNVQFKRGGKGTTPLQIEHFRGDGIVEAFTVGYPIAHVPTVRVATVLQTIGIKGLETGRNCYWSKGDATIVFEIPPTSGAAIEIQYQGLYPLIARAMSEPAILARRAIEGGSGIVEDITTEAQHESSDAILEAAKVSLRQYCQEAEKFNYATYQKGLAPGQIQRITYAPFGYSAHQMLIEAISITATAEYVRYNVSCATGPLMGSWVRFFTNLLALQDKKIHIGDSLLLLLFQQQETLPMVETTRFQRSSFGSYVWS